jgi:hypothetical protein
MFLHLIRGGISSRQPDTVVILKEFVKSKSCIFWMEYLIIFFFREDLEQYIFEQFQKLCRGLDIFDHNISDESNNLTVWTALAKDLSDNVKDELKHQSISFGETDDRTTQLKR